MYFGNFSEIVKEKNNNIHRDIEMKPVNVKPDAQIVFSVKFTI